MSDADGVGDKRAPQQEKQGLKLLIELGPLLIFFAVYAKFGIFAATGVLMATTLVSLIASKILLGHITVMPIVTAVIVTIFGGLTLWLQDATFIKMKPTIVNVLFAGVLAAGLFIKRPFLKLLFDEAFQLTDLGWTKLTLRWIGFFLFVAVLNEVVWRNFSETTWVNFKVFGILPLTMVFAAAQIKLIQKYANSA